MSELDEIVESKLDVIFRELSSQHGVGKGHPRDVLPFEDEMNNLREYIHEAGEYAIAYEVIVSILESYPFQLSGKAAVLLLELGLFMKYKTDRPEDADFDLR